MIHGNNFTIDPLPRADRTLTGIGLKDVLDLLPNRLSLSYVSYDDQIACTKIASARSIYHTSRHGQLSDADIVDEIGGV